MLQQRDFAMYPCSGPVNRKVRSCSVVLTLALLAAFSSPVFAVPPPAALQQVARLLSTGQSKKAVTEADRILAMHPDSAQAHYYKGKALEQLGSRQDAIASYETASLLDPGAKFAAECQSKIKTLAAAEASASSFKNVINQGKQTRPFKLSGQESRVVIPLTDRFKQALKDDVTNLYSAAENGPSLSGGAGAGYTPAPAREPMQLATSIGIPPARLNAKEKAELIKYDVIFIVDHSGSMSTRDCPQNSSRWDWLAAQVYSIGRDAQDCFPRGLRVVMFDDKAEEYVKVTPTEFVNLFKYYSPEGGTRTAYAFRTQMNAIQAKILEKKPVMVVGLTDGLPNDASELQQVFHELKLMASKTAVPLKVSLIQIGASTQGLQTLNGLEALTYQGVISPADKGFVQVHSFTEVSKYGLARVLLNILNK
ncbi:MAG: hypothetical protein K2W95_22395 [Candidatus Obscuribacterales bacterium]|nr:hypothetical protein [Candidatus Obscuribacterales bacterium]